MHEFYVNAYVDRKSNRWLGSFFATRKSADVQAQTVRQTALNGARRVYLIRVRPKANA